MQTECTPELFEFEDVERRAVVARFDGGTITSTAGALLLRQLDRGIGLVRRFSQCFVDRRDPRFVEHRVETLVGQRIFAPAYHLATRTLYCRAINWRVSLCSPIIYLKFLSRNLNKDTQFTSHVNL
jgi:hypothetical protein